MKRQIYPTRMMKSLILLHIQISINSKKQRFIDGITLDKSGDFCIMGIVERDV